MAPTFRSLFGSIALHAAIVGFALGFFRANPTTQPFKPQLLLPVEVERPSKGSAKTAGRRSVERGSRGGPSGKLDLRPSFAKNGFLASPPDTGSAEESGAQGILNPWSRELLFTESKVFDVFDLLASRIDKNLDFPWMLAEHGIHGMASLELFFDREGRIDESRSKFSGNHRLLRGLLVKAARAGLVEWFSNDTHRIRKEQFRNQNFRADFLLSSGTDNSSGLSKEREGSYRLLRRRYIRPAVSCVTSALTQPSLAMVDFGCLGAQVAGAVRRKVDSKYIARFNALKDMLEEYDRRELHGINSQVEGNS